MINSLRTLGNKAFAGARKLTGKVVEALNEGAHAVKAAVVGGIAAVAAFFSPASAQAADFDADTYITSFSGAATTIAGIVGGLVAIGAGLLLYKKVRAFFSRSS